MFLQKPLISKLTVLCYLHCWRGAMRLGLWTHAKLVPIIKRDILFLFQTFAICMHGDACSVLLAAMMIVSESLPAYLFGMWCHMPVTVCLCPGLCTSSSWGPGGLCARACLVAERFVWCLKLCIWAWVSLACVCVKIFVCYLKLSAWAWAFLACVCCDGRLIHSITVSAYPLLRSPRWTAPLNRSWTLTMMHLLWML